MNVIYGLDSLTEPLRDTAVAIGVFDGVHRGHQEILHQTAREARSQGYAPLALTFDIHPSELFAPDRSPPYLASLAQRARWIGQCGGVETVVVVHFDRAFAALPPQDFVADVLEARLGARHVLVGADFCYGKGRAGNVTTLLQSGAENNFAVTVVPPILLQGTRISSTQIRGLVAAGDLPGATRLLGHPFVFAGTVVPGKRLGQALGYPTANVYPVQERQILPADGIYAAWAYLADSRAVRAAVSVGTNPTTDSDGSRKVEAFLMDGFTGDLYGQPLALDFRHRVRDERQFPSLAALAAQMRHDVRQIETLLLPASAPGMEA